MLIEPALHPAPFVEFIAGLCGKEAGSPSASPALGQSTSFVNGPVAIISSPRYSCRNEFTKNW